MSFYKKEIVRSVISVFVQVFNDKSFFFPFFWGFCTFASPPLSLSLSPSLFLIIFSLFCKFLNRFQVTGEHNKRDIDCPYEEVYKLFDRAKVLFSIIGYTQILYCSWNVRKAVFLRRPILDVSKSFRPSPSTIKILTLSILASSVFCTLNRINK